MRVTLRQVAERAGVSIMSASVVLHKTGSNVTLSAEKADRIRAAAKELNYRPNRLAQSLKNKRTGSIGVVFQHFDRLGPNLPYHIQILNGVMSALFPRDYTLSLCPRMNQQGDIDAVSDGRFDGVIWCRPDISGIQVKELERAHVPVVILHSPPKLIPNIPTFCLDNIQAMRQVVCYLAEIGHRRIGFVIDPVSIHSIEGEDRLAAIRQAAAEHGLPEPACIVLARELDFLAEYAEGRGPQTALVCFSDNLAGVLLSFFRLKGVKVPSDVSVLGFDSSEFCETTTPRLTSASQPVEQMAREATNYLLDMVDQFVVNGEVPPPIDRVYAAGLDVRDSTAPPRIP